MISFSLFISLSLSRFSGKGKEVSGGEVEECVGLNKMALKTKTEDLWPLSPLFF